MSLLSHLRKTTTVVPSKQNDSFICTNCYKHVYPHEKRLPKYCPNCGKVIKNTTSSKISAVLFQSELNNLIGHNNNERCKEIGKKSLKLIPEIVGEQNLVITMEEISETIAEIIPLLYYLPNANKTNLTEEIADLICCIHIIAPIIEIETKDIINVEDLIQDKLFDNDIPFIHMIYGSLKHDPESIQYTILLLTHTAKAISKFLRNKINKHELQEHITNMAIAIIAIKQYFNISDTNIKLFCDTKFQRQDERNQHGE